MTRGIAPGVLALVVRSESGNNGAVVEVIRWVPQWQVVPECSLSPLLQVNHAWAGWLCKASRPLRRNAIDSIDVRENTLYGVFSPEQIVPITPPDDAQDTTTDTPADAVAA